MILKTTRYRLTDIAEVERAKKDTIYPAGTVFIQVSATNGQVKMLTEPGTIETKYATIIPWGYIDPFYFCEAVKRAVPEFTKKYQSTLNIQMGDFKFFQIDIHDDPATQIEINFLFRLCDHIVTTEQELHNYLKRLKKAMLQKLFNQEVRFKKDDGTDYADWEEKSISTLVVPANKDKVDTSKYKKITIGLHKKGISYSTVHENMVDTRPFYRRYKGELIIGKQNYFNGSIAIIPDEFDGCICSNAIMSFIFNDCVNGRFLYEAISRDIYLAYHSHLAEGGGQKELSEKKFLQMTVAIPSDIEEQTKIANCLAEFDNLIDASERRLEAYKLLKKSMMQKMFV